MRNRKLIQALDRNNKGSQINETEQANQAGKIISELISDNTDALRSELQSAVKRITAVVEQYKKELGSAEVAIGRLETETGKIISIQSDLAQLKADIQQLPEEFDTSDIEAKVNNLLNRLGFVLDRSAEIQQAINRSHQQGADTTLGVQERNLDMGGHKIVDVEGSEVATKKDVEEGIARTLAVSSREKGGGVGRYGHPADNEYARWNRDRIEGRSVAEVKEDLSVEDADIQALIDAMKLDDLAAPDDNTDLNASTSKHGLLPKLGGGTSNFLRADGSWAAPAGGGDMLKATYDPQTIEGDAFDCDEHTDGTTNGVFTLAERTKLAGVATGADVTGDNAPKAHKDSHTDGSDDIQDATSGQKGLATATQITKLDGIEALADVTGSHTCDTPGGAGTDTAAVHDNEANEISGVAEKTTPASADVLIIEDSAASYVKKKVQITNLPAGTPGADSINDTHIDWGAGANQVDADDVPESATKKWAGATGADVTADNAPQAHAASHQNGGSDEPSVAGLSGLLADDQHVLDAEVLAVAAAVAHKDTHDPNDGADPLDCAAAGEIVGVAAAAEGTAHSFARSDHTHQIQHAITDNHIVTVDGSPNDDEYARFTASGLEGLTLAEMLTALFASSLPENVVVLLDFALSADGKYSGIAFQATAGAALSFGEVCYLSSADSKWEKAQGDAEATVKPLTAVCCVAAAENNTATFLFMGTIREDDWNWTVGAPIFIDPDTAGALTQTELTTGEYQKCVGWAVDANTMIVTPNPDWVKVG